MPSAFEVLRFLDSASRYEEVDTVIKDLVGLPTEALDAALVQIQDNRKMLATYERFLVAAKARLEA